MPNTEQIKTILQLLLGTGGPLAALILSYGVPADRLTLWTNLALAVLPPLLAFVWGMIDRTHKNTIASAAGISGVQRIVIASNASDGAAKAAADDTLLNVQKAT